MILTNNRYEVTFTAKGGEIESFTDLETGIQYMWQGHPDYWTGKNPGLFPLVGNTLDGTYEMDGKTYAMKNHGLVRYATLDCVCDDGKEVVIAFDSSAETKAQYPFDFHYEVGYALQDDTLTVTYRITNTGEREMPFTFGLHPGFNCPLCEGEAFEDYTMRFSNPEKLKQLVFDPEKKKPYTLEDVELQTIPCSYEEIEKYATLIYQGMKSSYLTLSGPNNHGVRISISGYPYLAIWTAKKNAPFICLEPWYGHADFSRVEEDFSHREGTMTLSAGKTFTTAYTIQVF